MTNGNTGGDHGSPSKPTPPNPNSPRREENPRRRSGGANAPPASPRGRGSPSSPPKTRPVMGVPGESAFAPYTKTTQPRTEPGGSAGHGVGEGAGFQGAQAVPVGGEGYGGVVAPGALSIGGSPAARKRVREGGAGSSSAAAGGNQPAEGAGNVVNCSVCGKGFLSPKALFGHMRSHPDRGWKGAHPPPTFNAEEEFADLPGLNLPGGASGGDAQEGAADDDQKQDEAVESSEDEEEEAGDPGNYRVPDLNNPPPPDAN